MAHESCKSQIAVLEMNGQSVPQRWTVTSMREGSNTARRQCRSDAIYIVVERRAVRDSQSEDSGVQGVWMQGGT